MNYDDRFDLIQTLHKLLCFQKYEQKTPIPKIIKAPLEGSFHSFFLI